MRLPAADRAVVDPDKVRAYLLSHAHPVGRFKAAFFAALGYSVEKWEILRDDLLTLARDGEVGSERIGPFGRILEVDGTMMSPLGRTIEMRTVWILRTNEDFARFVTAFPR